MHLLKSKYQSEKKSKSWINSINHSKTEVEYILKDNPSLKRKLKDIANEAYKLARSSAAIETGIDLKKFPEECPWNITKLLNEK